MSAKCDLSHSVIKFAIYTGCFAAFATFVHDSHAHIWIGLAMALAIAGFCWRLFAEVQMSLLEFSLLTFISGNLIGFTFKAYHQDWITCLLISGGALVWLLSSASNALITAKKLQYDKFLDRAGLFLHYLVFPAAVLGATVGAIVFLAGLCGLGGAIAALGLVTIIAAAFFVGNALETRNRLRTREAALSAGDILN